MGELVDYETIVLARAMRLLTSERVAAHILDRPPRILGNMTKHTAALPDAPAGRTEAILEATLRRTYEGPQTGWFSREIRNA